ncbi:amidohydrolase family protein [Paraburkholderia xenovorans LB400]|uniref:Dihydroorotase n=1 Tax=Paraburkholderia xenovorans (strain LB400) TaxID=266265 RepID=Q143U0_PARXL|nr:D-aminoacylase [Paraburkholderia xenovorans]ABE29399.1 dihydroorotase [Paraburkholderia xenovorans LB400]AIP30281.1 amidohydrolase family protein [Paraburkholderia xenovorans LB400]
MSATYDLVIRGGSVIDGLGGPAIETDIGIIGGRIAEIGSISTEGREEIDARGQIVTPGFVDIHTHYDGQAMWESRFLPSSWHGVTTVVMGNCGVGFAPVRVQDRDRLIELMEGVEDIPGIALHEGLDWQWEGFASFMAALERRPHDIDFCAHVPHAALRVYVMGARAARLEMATPEDVAEMRRLTAEAVRAGAIGVSTSRSINHKSVKGDPTPSLRAAENELLGLALGVKDAGRGVLQMIMDFDDPTEIHSDFAMMRRLVEQSGRPLSFSLMQKHGNTDGWRKLLALTEEANRDGLQMRAQVAPRGIGVLLGLQTSRNIFSECPTYRKFANEPLASRIAQMRKPEIREALIAELVATETGLGKRLSEFDNIFAFGDLADYDPGEDASITAISRQQNRSPEQVAYDLTIANEGRGILYSPFANYAFRNLDACAEMMESPYTVLGLGDGGAHVAMISDSSFQTFVLTHYGRGGLFDLPHLVKRQTSDTARMIGLLDRGHLAPGMKADLNVIDMNALEIQPPHMFHDLPAGGGRLLQNANGYVATIVSGVPVYRHGKATGALPGKLVRGQQPAPQCQ